MPPQKERALSNFVSPSRNHLILLIGFLIIVSALVGFAFVYTGPSLEPSQRWLMLLFLLLFPVFGLITTVWLILRHHRKLTVASQDEEISWQLMLPDNQRHKLNGEVIELAAVMNVPKQQLSDLRSAYIVAEDLALRQIEQESKQPLMRHVSIGGADFDGIVVSHDIVTCVDVTFVVKPEIAKEKIDSLLKKIEYTVKKLREIRPGSKMRLLLAIVTQLDPAAEAHLRSILVEKFSMTMVDVDIRLMDFEGLQRIFAAD
jgi:hypothetical protein